MLGDSDFEVGLNFLFKYEHLFSYSGEFGIASCQQKGLE